MKIWRRQFFVFVIVNATYIILLYLHYLIINLLLSLWSGILNLRFKFENKIVSLFKINTVYLH